MSTPIKLADVIKVSDPTMFKLHLACRNVEGTHPLDEYISDRSNWVNWCQWRGQKNDWTRPFIFSFMDFYPMSNACLFGGIFKVIERLPDRYVIEEVEEYKKWEGRLICRFSRYQGMRGRAFRLEGWLDSFEVLQILPERYDGEKFCGYESINHQFSILRPILHSEKQDWKASLKAVKGVYLIMDTSNGMSYVGSAYGDSGIWSRLACYLQSGHGWNDALVDAINQKGIGYALANFKFSILEVCAFTTPDAVIIERESHWKNVMLSRQFGYNKN